MTRIGEGGMEKESVSREKIETLSRGAQGEIDLY